MNSDVDMARRLLARFHINNARFRDKNFSPFPDETLYPVNDQVKNICDEIRMSLEN